MKPLLIFLLVLALPAHADLLRNLYDAEVAVADRSAEALSRGTAAALEEVLIRMSGRQDVGRNPTARGALQTARNFLQKYSYRTDDDQLYLQTRFSDVQVNRLLERAALPVWSANRPPVLVWLLASDGHGLRLAKPETDPEIVAQLAAQARRRGVPLSYPLFDYQDSSLVSLNDIRELNVDRVAAASERYRPGSILIGRISAASETRWQGEWRYLLDGIETAVNETAGAGGLASAPIDLVANQLGAKFAITAWQGANNSTLIGLTGITGFGDYADAITYLESVAGIEHANMVYQSDSKLIVELVMTGTLQKADQFFKLDGKLKAVEVPAWEQAPAAPDATTGAAITAVSGADSRSEYLDDGYAEFQPATAGGFAGDNAENALLPRAAATAPAVVKTYQWLGSRG